MASHVLTRTRKLGTTPPPKKQKKKKKKKKPHVGF